jgi:hypothetical protein
MRRIRFLVYALGVFIGCRIAVSSQAQAAPRESKLPKAVDDALWWLPENTQTLIVAQGPWRATAPEHGSDVDALGLERTLQLMTLAAVGSEQLNPHLGNRLRGRTIAFSIQGCRRFRFPHRLGMMRFEGASIAVFQDDLGADGNALMDALIKQATKTETLAGVQVVTFDGLMVRDEWDFYWGLPRRKVEGDPEPTYVAHPRANILIWANDRDYLTSVLARMTNRAATRAFPASLPEWNHLDATAKVWAFRHYDRKDDADDPTSPLTGRNAPGRQDNEAVGLVFWLDSRNRNSAEIKYLSANKNALRIIQDSWQDPEKQFTEKIRQDRPGVVDISISTEKPSGESNVGIVFLLLLHALGHGVCL